MAVEVVTGDGVVAIEGEMTIYFATELKAPLLVALKDASDPVVLDLSRVADMDTAGLQLLLMTRAVVQTSRRALQIRAPSPAVTAVLELCGLQDWLRDERAEAA